MPELPEVETVARGLDYLVGQRLESLELVDGRVWFESELPAQALSGRELREVARRGKYLLLRFAGGLTLVQHLRMTGKMLRAGSPLVPAEVAAAVSRKTGKGLQVRARFRFTNVEIWFFDTRRFGTLTLVQNEEAFFRAKKIAPDPILETERAYAWFAERLPALTKAAKAALLDQAVVAGVGNIYADEALYAARLHPQSPASQIREPRALWEEILRLLRESIERGGSTIRDYVSAEGKVGEFAQSLLVYDRGGEPCPSCGAPLKKITVAGRSTHFCAICQPRRRQGRSRKTRRAPRA